MARNAVSTEVRMQKQISQHVSGGKLTAGKSVMRSVDDAKRVLSAMHSGEGKVLMVLPQNRVIFKYTQVSGEFIHQGSATPTNYFMIKGEANGATIVPINPATAESKFGKF